VIREATLLKLKQEIYGVGPGLSPEGEFGKAPQEMVCRS